MSIEVVDAGILTLVQDLGRWDGVRFGLPVSGPMDAFAFMAANALVSNDRQAAGLEITMTGPTLVFREPCLIAVTGANLGPRLDGLEVEGWKTYLASPGSILDFSGRRWGARAYLGISGGITVEPRIGSRSTYLTGGVGGLDGRALRAGDRLPTGMSAVPMGGMAFRAIPRADLPAYGENPTLRVILGPHADRFTEAGLNTFLSSSYEISPASDRMGYRLQGPRIAHSRGADVSSCGLPEGAIQVPGDGQPILLMADHQTAGGYTVIAVVIQADIPLAAQCLPGESLRFRAVSFEDARESLRRQMETIGAVYDWEGERLWRC